LGRLTDASRPLDLDIHEHALAVPIDDRLMDAEPADGVPANSSSLAVLDEHVAC